MALRLKDPPAPLRQVLQSQGMFGMGTQDNIRRSMDSTYANLRGVAPQGNPFEPPAQETSPSAPVASMVDGAPSIFGMTMGKPAESAISALPANLQVAGGLSRLEDAGKAYAFQTGLRDIGAANLNPEGQAPGDFMQAMKAAQSLYSRQYGPAGAGLAAGGTRMPNIQAFAPTGLRQRALAAGGAPVEGVGGAMVSASPNAQGGTNFALSQNPATIGAAPQAAPAPQAPAPQQSQYEADVNAYKEALNPTASSEIFTAPDGSMFRRDNNGRLQPAGSNPDMSAAAKAKEAAASEEARLGVVNAYKLFDDVAEQAKSSRSLIGDVRRVRELYDAGAVSGFAQPVLTKIGSVVSRITGKEEKISNQQQLDNALSRVALTLSSQYAKGQGSVSNYERELFQKAAVSENMTKDAVMGVLGALENVARRNDALDAERTRLEGMGLPTTQIAKEIRSMQRKMLEDSDVKYGKTEGEKPKTTKKVGAFTVEEEAAQ